MNTTVLVGSIGVVGGIVGGAAWERRSATSLDARRAAVAARQADFDAAFPRDSAGQVHGDVDAYVRGHPVPPGVDGPARGSAQLDVPSRHFGLWTAGATAGLAVGASGWYQTMDWANDLNHQSNRSPELGAAFLGGAAAGVLVGRVGARLVAGRGDR